MKANPTVAVIIMAGGLLLIFAGFAPLFQNNEEGKGHINFGYVVSGLIVIGFTLGMYFLLR